MGLAIAVVKHCEGCIAYHAQAAAPGRHPPGGRRGPRRRPAHGRRASDHVRAPSVGGLRGVRLVAIRTPDGGVVSG
jgi:hypothetical protein